MVKSILSNKGRERFFRYAPLFLWIGVILFLSSGQASMSQTSRFVRPLLEFLFPNTAEEMLVIYHGYIRKLAHFAEYAVLGFWASRAFINSNKCFLRRYWYILAFLVVIFIATTDEFNQSLNPARTGSLYDVLLDCSGGITLIFVYYLLTVKKNNVPDNKADNF